jgi:hypothetical protein
MKVGAKSFLKNERKNSLILERFVKKHSEICVQRDIVEERIERNSPFLENLAPKICEKAKCESRVSRVTSWALAHQNILLNDKYVVTTTRMI